MNQENTDSTQPNGSEEEPPNKAVIASYPSESQAHDAGLAILASNDAYWVVAYENRFLLIVSSPEADRLRKELLISESFNHHWPPVPFELPIQKSSLRPTIVAVVILIICFALQSTYPYLKDIGLNSKQGILQNLEWWRALTAVSLHADLGHLAGNLLGLSLFSYFASRYLGSGLAWASILLVSILANATNSIISSHEDFRSLGASTAVFAALGLISGVPVGGYFKDRKPILSRDWIIPFFSGCVLFSWMGGGDFPTDVTGHALSFAYGSVLAIMFSWIGLQSNLAKPTQTILLYSSLSAFILSWTWALL